MPQVRADPIVAHAFASHDFTVTFGVDAGADSDAVAAARATAETELRELLPSRVPWRADVRWTWSDANDAVVVNDQRAAAFFAGVLRRHRVIRAGDAEIRAAANASADSAKIAESRMNLDQDLFDAATGVATASLVPAIGKSEGGTLPLPVAAVAEHVRENASFLGAYDSTGAPNVIVAAIVAIRGRAAMSDLTALVRDKSRMVRGLGLLFARFALPPEELAPLFGLLPEAAATAKKAPVVWADAPVLDGTVVTFDDEGSHGPFRDFARLLLLNDEAYELWLPTYAPCVVEAFKRRIELTEAVAAGKHAAVAAAAAAAAQAASAAPVAAAPAAPKPVKKTSTVIAGFKSATAMAKYFRRAYELAEQGATTSNTNMGSGSIVVRSAGPAGAAAAGGLGNTVPGAAVGGAEQQQGVPQGVAAKTREQLMAETKQRRLDRLRGGANAALATHRKRAAAGSSAGGASALPPLDAAGGLTASPDGAMWPSELAGLMNQHGTLDDLFKDKAAMRMLYSATVGPEDVEVTF